MELSIRPAEIKDAERIADIQIACWKERLSAWAPEWFVAQFKADQQKTKYAERIAGDVYHVFVAEKDGTCIGFAALKPNEKPEEFSCQLGALYVDPKQEGKGIGTELLKAMIAYAKDKHLGDIIVWTFRDNTASRKLYEKCGGKLLSFTDSEDMDLDIPHVSYGWTF